MNTSSQPKKLLSQQSKLKEKPESVLKAIESGTWNPFKRVDPKILEMLHRKHEKARKQVLLTQTEEAPI